MKHMASSLHYLSQLQQEYWKHSEIFIQQRIMIKMEMIVPSFDKFMTVYIYIAYIATYM